jgi:hypothetical protein
MIIYFTHVEKQVSHSRSAIARTMLVMSCFDSDAKPSVMATAAKFSTIKAWHWLARSV